MSLSSNTRPAAAPTPIRPARLATDRPALAFVSGTGRRVELVLSTADGGQTWTGSLTIESGAALTVDTVSTATLCGDALLSGTTTTFTGALENHGVITAIDGAVVAAGGVENSATGDVTVAFPDGYQSAAVVMKTDEDWDLVMAVNVRSVFLGAKYAVPHMLRRGGGSIINTASISGLHGDGGAVVYAASKAAVINLTRALSTDHAPDGIRVNAICPGTIETPPVQRMMADPAALQANLSAHALGRLGRPEEIANAALWLASDEASFVSGEAIVVDGGLRARSPLGRMGDPRPAGMTGQDA